MKIGQQKYFIGKFYLINKISHQKFLNSTCHCMVATMAEAVSKRSALLIISKIQPYAISEDKTFLVIEYVLEV